MTNCNKIKLTVFSLATLFVAAACSGDQPRAALSDDARTLTVTASLKGMNTFTSRAGIALNHDGWSYSGFSVNDVMGFYSEHGDYYADLGEDEIINLPLIYAGNSQFKNENNFQFSPSRMSAEDIFMYFPWSADMVDAEGGSLNAPGMELRQLNEGFYKCVDFLDVSELDAASLAGGAIIGKFRHAFSELIIMRGEGFENPPAGKDQIWVVMQNPFTHIKINFTLEPEWSCYPELTYDPTYVPEGFTGNFEANKWQAWQGGNYTITEQDVIGVPAWYALIPCLGENNTQYTVTAIELYDNEGNLQKVTNLSLAPLPGAKNRFTKYVNQSWRYPLVVEMKELVPTVQPYPIIPWEGDTDLTNERGRGIANAFDFQTWLHYYLAYLQDGGYDNLLQYGDKIVDTDGNLLYWHFYLLDDIDLSQLQPDDDTAISGVYIPELKDILDGVNLNEMENNTRPNYSISGLTKPLVGTISGYGVLQNIDFISPDIKSTSTSPIGILANTMSGTSTAPTLIDNCNIEFGSLMSQGPVGFVAGSINNATIQNCSVAGFMVGSLTISDFPYFNIAGVQTGANTIENNETNIVFEPLN